MMSDNIKREKGVDTYFTIVGRKYDNIPQYYDWDTKKLYPNYECLNERIFELDKRDGVISLDTAQEWLISKHPDYYFGGGIIEKYKTEPLKENKEPLDFMAIAIPSYYESLYESTDRNYILNEIKKDLINLKEIEDMER